MEWEREAILTGAFRYKHGMGGVRPELRVDHIEYVGSFRLLTKDRLIERWSQAITRKKRSLDQALLVSRPRVVVVTGQESVALGDIRDQLKDAEEDIELKIERVAITRPEEVARTLRHVEGAHVVVLTRGGGQDVHELDTDGVIEAIASSPIPIAVALGHADDRLVLNRVADAAFATPTAFGSWLRNAIEQKREQGRHVEVARKLEETKSLLEQVGSLRGQNKALTQEVKKLKQQRDNGETRTLEERKPALEELITLRAQTQAQSQELERLRQAPVATELKQPLEPEQLLAELDTLRATNVSLLGEVEQLRQRSDMADSVMLWRGLALALGLLLLLVFLFWIAGGR